MAEYTDHAKGFHSVAALDWNFLILVKTTISQ